MAIDRIAAYELALPDDDTFDQAEALFVCRDFVCAVCHQDLEIFYIKGHFRVMVGCIEHGNVTSCGRVTRNTVNIEDERAHRLFAVVVLNLPDLWGQFAPKKQTVAQNLKDLGF